MFKQWKEGCKQVFRKAGKLRANQSSWAATATGTGTATEREKI
jgi:hypothetical protein